MSGGDSLPRQRRRKSAVTQDREEAAMNGARTRKSRNGGTQHMMNGNGKVHLPAGDYNDAATEENIFLFYPNLIGSHFQDCMKPGAQG